LTGTLKVKHKSRSPQKTLTLFTWRRQLLAAAIESRGSDCGFVPVSVASQPAAQAAATEVDRAIEIRLASGIVIRVGREVEIEPLQRVLRALGQ